MYNHMTYTDTRSFEYVVTANQFSGNNTKNRTFYLYDISGDTISRRYYDFV